MLIFPFFSLTLLSFHLAKGIMGITIVALAHDILSAILMTHHIENSAQIFLVTVVFINNEGLNVI